MNELLEALQVLNKYGLTVVDDTGKQVNKPKKKRPNKRPNGSGSIVKLSGTRRKPYGVYITVGYDDFDGHQIQKALGYFETREKAQDCLDHWNFSKTKNKNHIRIPTFSQIFDKIFEEEVSNKSYSTRANYKSAFKRLDKLHNIPIDKITLHQLQPIFDECSNMSNSYLLQMKVVCSAVFKYGMKYDYIDKDYAQYIDISKHNKETVKREVFTQAQIRAIERDNSKVAQLVLLSIYTGMRPIELCTIKVCDVHLTEHYMIGGAKTKSGKNRVIPLHDHVLPIVENLLHQGYERLCYDHTERGSYSKYLKEFGDLMERLGIEHLPYDTRHTFATLAKMYHLEEYARKRILGHASKDITDDVYTHASIEYLVKEVNKIK